MTNNQPHCKVSISLVTWHSREYLPECLESISKQTFTDYSIIVVDNASNDGSVEYIQKNYPQIKIIQNKKNHGYSKAHNQAIQTTKSDYVLCLNPDIILTSDYLAKLVGKMEDNQRIGSIAGKLYRLEGPADLNKQPDSVTIDSTGLQIFKSRKVVNRGEGAIDKGQFDQPQDVFGHSGALVLYRRQALVDCAVEDEYFDEDFFAYKEDVDLAWRLSLRNWRISYEPAAIAWHKRRRQAKQRKNKKVNYYSYRNHLWLLVKNEVPDLFWSNFLSIALYELSKFFYILFFEWSTLPALADFFKLLPKMRKKRKVIMSRRSATSQEFRKWFI